MQGGILFVSLMSLSETSRLGVGAVRACRLMTAPAWRRRSSIDRSFLSES